MAPKDRAFDDRFPLLVFFPLIIVNNTLIYFPNYDKTDIPNDPYVDQLIFIPHRAGDVDVQRGVF